MNIDSLADMLRSHHGDDVKLATTIIINNLDQITKKDLRYFINILDYSKFCYLEWVKLNEYLEK